MWFTHNHKPSIHNALVTWKMDFYAFLVEKNVVTYKLHPVRMECTNHNLETLNANFLDLKPPHVVIIT